MPRYNKGHVQTQSPVLVYPPPPPTMKDTPPEIGRYQICLALAYMWVGWCSMISPTDIGMHSFYGAAAMQAYIYTFLCKNDTKWMKTMAVIVMYALSTGACHPRWVPTLFQGVRNLAHWSSNAPILFLFNTRCKWRSSLGDRWLVWTLIHKDLKWQFSETHDHWHLARSIPVRKLVHMLISVLIFLSPWLGLFCNRGLALLIYTCSFYW